MAIGVVSLSYLLLLCLPLLSEGRETRRPLRSVKAPAETIVDYDVATPAVAYRSSQDDYPKQLHILIKIGGSSLTLQLQRNDYVLSAGFTSRHYTPDGAVVEEKGHDHCFYQGQVLEHPGWTAAMSTCRGLRGSFGDMGSREKFYHLEPLSQDSLSLEQPHALYLDTELKERAGQCGTASHGGVKGSPPSLEAALPGRAGRRLRRLVSGFYIVEWTIYNDIAQYQAFGSSTVSSKLRALETANNVDNLYRVLRIRIALVAVVTWSSGDPITSSTDPNAILNGFQSYLVGQPLTDSAMLMTGRNLDGNVVGLASVATMCSGGQSSGLSQDGGRSTDGVAATAAHELGHILNMDHDDAASCNCADGQSQCIMAAVSGPDQPTTWSQCSDDDLNEGFGSFSLNRCLTNEPIMTVGDPACGNGIREGEEVCDCGIAEECQDPCCNSSTCQLVDGAQCFSGDCCDSSCQFVAYGTTCRSAGGECGILEYCSGQDGTCPQDLHRQSGQACNSGLSLCYEGQCPSHQQQCLFHFGSGASDAHEQCFIQLNDNGNRNGNCGHSTTNFLPCSTSNTLCGQLQCVADFNNFINHFNLAVLLQSSSVRIPSGPFTSCTSFTTAVGSDVKSPGLTQDGTKCGDNKFCLEQSCVAVNQPACPSGDGGSICSGNGQCNNLNQCSCNVGFSGDTCSPLVTPTPTPTQVSTTPDVETPTPTNTHSPVSTTILIGGGGGGGGGNATSAYLGIIVGVVVGAALGALLLAAVVVMAVVGIVMVKRSRKSSFVSRTYGGKPAPPPSRPAPPPSRPVQYTENLLELRPPPQPSRPGVYTAPPPQPSRPGVYTAPPPQPSQPGAYTAPPKRTAPQAPPTKPAPARRMAPQAPPTKPAQHTSRPLLPATKPATPTSKPLLPATKPAPPTSKPLPATKPAPPASKPTLPATKPAPPTSKPLPATKPAPHTSKPLPATKPTPPASKPLLPATKPAPPTSKPLPATKPAPPTSKPLLPAMRPAPPTSCDPGKPAAPLPPKPHPQTAPPAKLPLWPPKSS